jgi:hypothetical protein
MLAASEIYKGIKFVRISSLPPEQKDGIWQSINHNSVIKILKDQTLLNDCLQYTHYVAWYENIYKPTKQGKVLPSENLTTKLAIAS